MEMYSLLINPRSFPKLANVGLPPNNPQQKIEIQDANIPQAH